MQGGDRKAANPRWARKLWKSGGKLSPPSKGGAKQAYWPLPDALEAGAEDAGADGAGIVTGAGAALGLVAALAADDGALDEVEPPDPATPTFGVARSCTGSGSDDDEALVELSLFLVPSSLAFSDFRPLSDVALGDVPA